MIFHPSVQRVRRLSAMRLPLHLLWLITFTGCASMKAQGETLHAFKIQERRWFSHASTPPSDAAMNHMREEAEAMRREMQRIQEQALHSQ